jgi:RNA polymerase sigma-70 factor (ECF subfamily)
MVIQEDNHIIGIVLKGDTDAYGQLVRKYQKTIYNLMYRTTGSEDLALEMAQETFTKAYEKLERFDPGRSFFSWLYAVGSNLSKDYLRKSGREVLFSDGEIDENSLVDDNLNQAVRLENKLEMSQIMATLQKLPFNHREALILRYQKDLPVREIAQALSISTDAAKMRIHRALKALRAML